jgi:hypothetical protein
MTAPPGQKPVSRVSMRVETRYRRAFSSGKGTGSIGLGFYTRDHAAPDLLKKQFPTLGKTP